MKRSSADDDKVSHKRPRRTPPETGDVPEGAAVILIRNKEKVVIDYTLVDSHHFDVLNQTKWCRTRDGYAQGIYQGKHRRLSHVVHMLNLPDVPIVGVVDHRNHDPLDNRFQNLLLGTVSDNNRNQSKRVGATSKYYGVHWNTTKRKFVASCRTKTKRLDASFVIEAHAAAQFDIWNEEHGHFAAARNNVPAEFLVDFIPYAPNSTKKKGDALPTGITARADGGYRVNISFGAGPKEYYFKSLDGAIAKREELFEEKARMETERIATLQAQPITRDDNGIAFHNVYKGDQIVNRTLVDDDTWRLVQGKRVTTTPTGYGQIHIDGKKWRLHRWIMRDELDANPELWVDHMPPDNNKMDNRRVNLRLATPAQNGQNKKKQSGTTSRFMGVYWNKKNRSWKSHICIDGKRIHLGVFETEEAAARARDEATKKYHTHGKLNF